MWILKVLFDDDESNVTLSPCHHIYLIETSSIENMYILAWFPLLLYKPKETMVSV